jgi:hypothetical protein
MEQLAIIQKEEKGNGRYGRINKYREYPEAYRHYKSLFPNNHVELFDWQNTGEMPELTDEFDKLVHNPSTTERDLLHFINHKPAYYIIGSLLLYHNFGHHDAYIFPEFSIGSGKYYADYLIIGKNSGGYEFLFVELEAPNGHTILKSNGHAGQATRLGCNQILDWKRNIASEFCLLTKEFTKQSKPNTELPNEFVKFDSTRFHYCVVSGLRKDYQDTTYYDRRLIKSEQNIDILHYDNLIDYSKKLETKNTF